MANLNDIIEGCKKGEQTAARLLYEMYSRQMRAICYRYVGNPEDAEDVMHDAFIRILTRIGQFRGEGSFEGWMKRVFVHTSLDFIKHKKNLSNYLKEEIHLDAQSDKGIHLIDDTDDDSGEFRLEQLDITREELMDILQSLPVGYRTVFNLYVLEDYSHKDIADMLNVSVSTSKTQLSKARKMLRTKLEDYAKRMAGKAENDSYRSYLKIVI